MSESFLHYLWQYQYFSREGLCTTDGQEIKIFHPGIHNTHAGPDFSNARIRIGMLDWAGHVEVHVKSSEWITHKHQHDEAYNNVILHVVWKKDKDILQRDGTLIPTLELRDRVGEKIIFQYKKLINSPEQIPCANQIATVPGIAKLSAFDKALTTRLQAKSEEVWKLLDRNENDWQETLYQLLCKNFGFKVNSEPFQQLAKAIPVKLIMKHADKPEQVEALLFGQAGFLEGTSGDEYFLTLKREYGLLSKKYSLIETQLKKAQWKFLRLRPANFPTVRIAQLASILCSRKNVFSHVLGLTSVKELSGLLKTNTTSYWHTHYSFGKKTKEVVTAIGDESIHNVIINTIVPLLTAYGKYKDDQSLVDRAVELLNQLPAENNKITRVWTKLGLACKTSFDSQAQIELYNNYCIKRRCLECVIGGSLIKPVQ
ncbi:MAG: DUF2851 family protein [Flammeovirgaceae bacterium]|nr:DUF2851 family protein [Flammeovirgaceae bacterium]